MVLGEVTLFVSRVSNEPLKAVIVLDLYNVGLLMAIGLPERTRCWRLGRLVARR